MWNQNDKFYSDPIQYKPLISAASHDHLNLQISYGPSDLQKSYGPSDLQKSYGPSDLNKSYGPSELQKSYGPSELQKSYGPSDFQKSYRPSNSMTFANNNNNNNGNMMVPLQIPQYQLTTTPIKETPTKINNGNPSLSSIPEAPTAEMESSKNVKADVNDTQIKFVLLFAEIERLTLANSNLNKELVAWKEKALLAEKELQTNPQKNNDNEVLILKQRNMELEVKINKLIQEAQTPKPIENNTISKDVEIQRLKNRIMDLEGIYQQQMERLSLTINGQEDLIIKLKQENEKLASNSTPVSDFEQLQKIREDLERKLLQTRSEAERVNVLLLKKTKDYDDLQAKLQALKNENDKLNLQLKDLDEIEKLTFLMSEKEKEIELWRNNYTDLETKSSNKIAENERTILILKQKFDGDFGSVRMLQENLKFAENKIQVLQLELTNMDIFKKEKENLEVQIKVMGQRIYELEDVLTKMNNDNIKLQEKLKLSIGSDADLKALKAKLHDSEEAIKKFMQEIQRLKDELNKKIDKDAQLKTLQLKNVELEEKLKLLNEEMLKMNKSIDNKAELQAVIDALLMKIKQYEERMNRLDNAFQENEDRILLLQGDNNSLLIEIDKLNKILVDIGVKNQALEDWKKKHDELEKKIKNDLELQKNHLENNHNKKLDDHKKKAAAQLMSKDQTIKDLEAKLALANEDINQKEKKIKELEEELKKVKDQPDNKNALPLNQAQELEKLKTALKDQENEIIRLKKAEPSDHMNKNLLDQLEQMKKRCEGLERDLAKSLDESRRVKDILVQKDSEILILTQTVEQAHNSAEDYIAGSFEEINLEIKVRLEKEKADLKAQIARERADIESQARTLNQKISEYEIRITRLMEENTIINNKITNDNHELDTLKTKYTTFENSKITEIEELKFQLDNAKRKTDQDKLTIQDLTTKQMLFFIEIERRLMITQELTDQLIIYQQNYNSLLNAYNELEHQFTTRIDDLEKRERDRDNTIKTLMAENSRLSDLSFQRLNEIDGLKIKYAQGFVVPQSDTEKVPNEDIDALKKKLNDANDNISKLELDKRNLELQMQRLNQQVESNQNEINRLLELLGKKKLENDALFKKTEELKTTHKNLECEYKLLEEKYREAIKEMENLQKTRDMYKNELEKYTRRDKDYMYDIGSKR